MTACNWAGPSGATGCPPVPNNNTAANNWYHAFYYDDLTLESTLAMDNARTMLDTTVIETDITLQDNGDVHVMDAAYDTYCDQEWMEPGVHGGLLALTECDSVNSGGQCLDHEIRLNRLYFEWDTEEYPPGCKISTATHEALHTLGLNHLDDPDDVMYGVQLKCIQWISTHNRDHLDAYYG